MDRRVWGHSKFGENKNTVLSIQNKCRIKSHILEVEYLLDQAQENPALLLPEQWKLNMFEIWGLAEWSALDHLDETKWKRGRNRDKQGDRNRDKHTNIPTVENRDKH